MKKRLLLLSCAAGLMLVPAKAEEHTELGKQMEALNDAFKGFRRETDPVKGAKEARAAQTEVLKGVAETPVKIKEMAEGPEKAKAAAEYRKVMGKLYVTLCDIEVAFLEGKIEEVTKLVETVKDSKKEGHDKFKKEEE